MSSPDHHLFPKQSGLYEQTLFCLAYAVRAPSTHNSQPWLFKIEEGKILLFADTSRRLPEGDKDGRDLYISLGACLEHLTIALQYFRMGGDIVYGNFSNNDTFVAQISVHTSTGLDMNFEPTIKAIQKRYNARGPFLPKTLPEDIWTKLAVLKEGNATLHIFRDKGDMGTLATLTGEGMREVHSQRAFRSELSQWMISNYSSRKDGIPGYAMLAPGFVSIFLPWIIRTFNMGKMLAKLNTKAITSASAIGIVTSETDTPKEWLEVGKLFERASLLLNTYDIHTSIFVASIEIPRLRSSLKAQFHFMTLPQFTFAFGYPKVILRQPPRLELGNRLI